MDYVKITTLDNAFEAQIVEEVLKDQGIAFIIRSYHDDVYGNLFQSTNGWGVIHAPISFREQILEVIKEVRASDVDLIVEE